MAKGIRLKLKASVKEPVRIARRLFRPGEVESVEAGRARAILASFPDLVMEAPDEPDEPEKATKEKEK